jgi:hypothetical protein
MSDLPMTLLDLDVAGLDPTQPAPVEFIQFLYDNSRSGYLTLWSVALAQPDGAAKITRWINDALAVYHARTLQTQMAPEGDKPAGDNVTEVTYGGSVVPAAPVCIDVPYVGGGAAVGDTLTCTMGNWGNEPVSYTYAWSSGGTESSYVVQAADAGTSITCVVSATNAGGTTAAPPSNAVMVPAAAGMAQASAAPKREYPKEEVKEEPKVDHRSTTGSADHRRK